MMPQTTKEKYLFYDGQTAQANTEEEHPLLNSGNSSWFWNDRLVLTESAVFDLDFWHFIALDLITNETSPVQFLKSDCDFFAVKVISLNRNYGFIVESGFDESCVTLVKLEWNPGEFQIIEKLGRQHCWCFEVLANSLNPLEFVLKYENYENDLNKYTYQLCKLGTEKIEFDKIYKPSNNFDHHFNDTLFAFHNNKIVTYDWKTEERRDIEIEPLSDGKFDICCAYEWVKEKVYAAVYFKDTRKNVIACTDLNIKRWVFFDFATEFDIWQIRFMNGNLMILAKMSDDEFKFYNIPVRRPQLLRRIAWPYIVQNSKQGKKIKNPYERAIQCLPLNTDLRPNWYKEEEITQVNKK